MDFRIFVEKKVGFDLEAQHVLSDITTILNIPSVVRARIINVYDIFGIESENVYAAVTAVFSEPNVDNVCDKLPEFLEYSFALEFLPGQYDQRADSAEQCLRLLSPLNEKVCVKAGWIYALDGEITEAEFLKIKNYFINPVEMREKDMNVLALEIAPKAQDIPVYSDFNLMEISKLEEFRNEYGLAMSLEDLTFTQTYFREQEKRAPFETEIRVLDTYWSDHCRHTTFNTKIENIKFPKTEFGECVQSIFAEYQESRKNVYGEGARDINLMDLATIVAKEMRKDGRLDAVEVSDEINACSVFMDVCVDGKNEKYLLMFKNETHNHPTEIEPFGGAATCLGGAIRDPLSGRSYVYQAIRLTGAANPLEALEDTLFGKLPQRKICKDAAHGYSSYGNQIGIATGLVQEFYHPGYAAKRMEVGAVVAAVPAANVRRINPTIGDVIILLGGKTGRDGCGGATGSSKAHTKDSISTCGAEVQRGNALVERKILRMFRNPQVATLIKKCNDFGAGGVSVAIGELAPGVDIDLNKIPVKYTGLNGTELAISESQERMAVVVSKEHEEIFIKLAEKENLLATSVAIVTDTNRLRMYWRDMKIVDFSRDFLDTNGISSKIDVEITEPAVQFSYPFAGNTKVISHLRKALADPNIQAKRGLCEMFDGSIGSSSVVMPFGGKFQMSPMQASILKIPVNGETDNASAITYGFDPFLAQWSPLHAGAYSVVECLAKLIAVGAKLDKIYLSMQEYFQKLLKEPERWGRPFVALLGAFSMQKSFGVAAIGGKDSMSGTFADLHVPPTIISFGVSPMLADDCVSTEFKSPNSNIYLLRHEPLKNQMPNVSQLKDIFAFLQSKIKDKKILASAAVGMAGSLCELTKMAFGNKIGFVISGDFDLLCSQNYGSIIVETKEIWEQDYAILLGQTIDSHKVTIESGKEMETIFLRDLRSIWENTLEDVYPTKYKAPICDFPSLPNIICKKTKSKITVAVPQVFIPIFPGTNTEYDMTCAFERAGGKTETLVFCNNTQSQVEASVEAMVSKIKNSQIMVFAGGYSAGDEPDGSGKFIAAVIRNARMADALHDLLERDGLILGVCNGFQALIKSGLLPYGAVQETQAEDPTLTFNSMGRHISKMLMTKISSTMSPWLASFKIESTHMIPISHGEGRFVASPKVFEGLIANGQVATQYVNMFGKLTTSPEINPNGSIYAVEGITSPDGRIFGKMGHSERKGHNLYKNIPFTCEQDIFINGVNYFK